MADEIDNPFEDEDFEDDPAQGELGLDSATELEILEAIRESFGDDAIGDFPEILDLLSVAWRHPDFRGSRHEGMSGNVLIDALRERLRITAGLMGYSVEPSDEEDLLVELGTLVEEAGEFIKLELAPMVHDPI